MHEFETSTRIAVRGEAKGHACAQCGGLADEHPEPVEEVAVLDDGTVNATAVVQAAINTSKPTRIASPRGVRTKKAK